MIEIIPFYVGIPKRCEIKLNNILKEQNIDSKVHLLYLIEFINVNIF